MKKRLRKKLYIGEFQESGFLIRADFCQSVASSQTEGLCDKIIDYCEDNNLAFGGSCNSKGIDAFLTRLHNKSQKQANSITQEECNEFGEFLKYIVNVDKLNINFIKDVYRDSISGRVVQLS